MLSVDVFCKTDSNKIWQCSDEYEVLAKTEIYKHSVLIIINLKNSENVDELSACVLQMFDISTKNTKVLQINVRLSFH